MTTRSPHGQLCRTQDLPPQRQKSAAQAVIIGVPGHQVLLAGGHFAIRVFCRLEPSLRVEPARLCGGARRRTEAVIVRVPGHQVLLAGRELAHRILRRLRSSAYSRLRNPRRRGVAMIISVPGYEVFLARGHFAVRASFCGAAWTVVTAELITAARATADAANSSFVIGILLSFPCSGPLRVWPPLVGSTQAGQPAPMQKLSPFGNNVYEKVTRI